MALTPRATSRPDLRLGSWCEHFERALQASYKRGELPEHHHFMDRPRQQRPTLLFTSQRTRIWREISEKKKKMEKLCRRKVIGERSNFQNKLPQQESHRSPKVFEVATMVVEIETVEKTKLKNRKNQLSTRRTESRPKGGRM